LKRIVFACAFGPDIGIGHAGRCASLAQFADLRGVETVLMTESDLRLLPEEMRNSFQTVCEGSWRSSSLPEVAASCDCMVVDDMYSPDGDFTKLRERLDSRNLRPVLLAIDDMQRRCLDAVDIVLNQEVQLREAGYRCRFESLLGEEYALLRRGLAEPEGVDWISENALPILIMIGGTDAFRLVPRVLESLSRSKAGRFAPVVVASERHPDRESIVELLSGFESSRLLSGLSSRSLAGWSACCDFAVIGCGTSTYEMAALGKRFIGLQLVDNQRLMGEAIARAWGQPVLNCENGGWLNDAFLASLEKMAAGDFALQTEVDLKGSDRVLDTIERVAASIPSRGT